MPSQSRLHTVAASSIPERLRHVYWIGGGSGAGKSTIARRLADRHSLQLYSTDEVMSDHARRCNPEDCPYLMKFMSMSMDERWVTRPPEVMLETFHWFRGEGFKLIVEDLLNLPPGNGVIVEGFRLIPELVRPMLDVPTHGVWLIPSPEFRRAAFESRGTLWSIASKTNHPERALTNLLERDRLFTERLERDAAREGVPTVAVATSMTEDVLSDRVATLFGLRPAPPRSS